MKIAKVVFGLGEKKSNRGGQYYQQHGVYYGDIALSHPASLPNGSYKYLIKDKDMWRIRKLTPKECWRLQGFSDELFERAETTCSNTQLYKQAGNSITVDVLENIFANLERYL